MLSIIFFVLTFYLDDLRENSIQNSCIFKIIRFNKNTIMCADYGLNKKYCNNYYLPYEFSVTKEFETLFNTCSGIWLPLALSAKI